MQPSSTLPVQNLSQAVNDQECAYSQMQGPNHHPYVFGAALPVVTQSNTRISGLRSISRFDTTYG